MKTTTVLLTAALGLSLAGGVWLSLENKRLRELAAGLPAPAAEKKKPAAGPRTSSPLNAPQHTAGTDRKDNGKTAPSGSAPPAGTPAAAAARPFTVQGNEDGSVTLTDTATGGQRKMDAAELAVIAREAQAAAAEHLIKRPGGPSWSPGQAAGAPNTAQHGDYSTAWASQQPDGGREWLKLKYGKPVEIGEINIHETYNPGAVAKVSAIMPDGSERVIWQGTGTPEDGVIERAVKVPAGIRSDQILIEMDTARVPGWNEIDAVELVGRDGSRQWAAESTASSYYGQGRYAPVSGGITDLSTGFIEYESLGLTRGGLEAKK